jgi:CHAT domain-containing protein/tetratricopeptide (TPR) repeat protein
MPQNSRLRSTKSNLHRFARWHLAFFPILLAVSVAWLSQGSSGSLSVAIETQNPGANAPADAKEARKLFAEAEALRAQEKPEALRAALAKYQEALALWQAAGNRREEVNTLNCMGLAYESLNEYRKALPLLEAVKDDRLEATTLSLAGMAHLILGEPKQGIDFLNRALPLVRALNDRTREAAVQSALGGAHLLIGEPQKALAWLDQALPLWRELKEPNGEAQTLALLSAIHSYLGQKETASNYQSRANELRKAASAHPAATPGEETRMAADRATAEGVRLLAEETTDSKRKAISKLTEALSLWKSVHEEVMESAALMEIGVGYSKIKEYPKVLECFQQALQISQSLDSRLEEAAIQVMLGETFSSLGRTQEALDSYQKARQMDQRLSDPYIRANALHGIGRIKREQGNLIEARSLAESALADFESLRTRIPSPDWRASFFVSKQDLFGFYIDLVMQLHQEQAKGGFDGLALQTCDRVRARGLLDALVEARADIRQGIEPSLLERERMLQQQINAKAGGFGFLLSSSDARKRGATDEPGLEDLMTEYRQLEAKIRSTSPHYAALTQPPLLSASQIQQVLDERTLLLEYSLGDKRSFLWVVSPATISSFTLPGRAEIETAARRFYELLSKREGLVPLEADRQCKEAGEALGHMILDPASHLISNQRLVIVCEGALQYIPFAALPVPRGSGGDRREGLPLMVEHEIVSLPSASTIAVLRGELVGRKPAPKAVAVLADPVFAQNDIRVKSNKAKQPAVETTPAARETLQSGRDDAAKGTAQYLPRLPFSRREAAAILALVRPSESLRALDFAANRSIVTSPELSKYRIVHIASHGFINSANPELSNIALSLVNDQGVPQDGHLRLHEIYNLHLPADLVVLSACQTGLGKDIRGEGLVGLTRGFMYAGAARVVVSLWRIDDEATAELMRHFYKGMLAEQKLSPAAALRAAQVAIWKEKRWRSPYYWGGFILQGEWR